MHTKVVFLLISFSVFVLGLNRGDKCTTPNGETATCRPVAECTVIRNAVTKGQQGAVDFARQSQCGRDTQPLVCCGTKSKLDIAIPCTTPNGEPATCLPISTCQIMLNAISSRNKDAIKFAQNSQCGNENGPMVCCGSDAYPLRTNLLPNRNACGEDKGEDRIWGGTITEIWEFPWMAKLRYNSNDGSDAGFKCGGTLINSRYVLTAAHCVSTNRYIGIQVVSVRLGEWRVSTERDCEEKLVNPECADPVVDLNVEEKIVHPSYRRKTGENDIALIRLERSVKFTDYIKPICLPVGEAPDPNPATEMYVVGWGTTENSTESDYKLKVKLPIVSRSTCNSKVVDSGIIGEDRICAGGERGKDSCKGDSGGPLMGSFSPKNSNLKPRYYQEGVVSRGVGCGTLGFPGVYTRVAKYMDWIIENLKSS